MPELLAASERLRVVVSGYLVRGPLAGMAWHHVQYVLGLAHLGHDVWFLEDSDDHEWSCYDPVRGVTDTDPTYGLAYTGRVFEGLSLEPRWAYYDAHTSRWLGPSADRMLAVCAEADVLLDFAINPLRPWTAAIPCRALVDTDPVFTQLDLLEKGGVGAHTAYFTYAENAGSTAALPDDGIDWLPTRQPVVLDAWPVTPVPERGSFTTVMQWESYPAREHGGRRYGMKSDSFAPYLDLPGRTAETLEIALGGTTAPRELLADHGWKLHDPNELVADPWDYRRFIQRSKGELTVAKHGYVASWSGWFSERSASYLASGRPVVTEDTGFSRWLPSGEGVVAFSSPEEALAGLEDVAARYRTHCAAARELAEEHFDSDKVLARLLEDALEATYGLAEKRA